MPLFNANTNRICTREALHLDTPHLPVDLPLGQLPSPMGPYSSDFLRQYYQPAPTCASSSQVRLRCIYIDDEQKVTAATGGAMAKDVGHADRWYGARHSEPPGDGRGWCGAVQGQYLSSAYRQLQHAVHTRFVFGLGLLPCEMGHFSTLQGRHGPFAVPQELGLLAAPPVVAIWYGSLL